MVFEAASGWEPTEIVYGGTFDPPHEGHAQIVQRALKLFPRATLRVIPAAAPAGAHGLHKRPVASFADRVAMCQLQFQNESDRIKIDSIEETLPQPNYTVRTLEALAQRFPSQRWGWLMGKDQLQSFPAWHEPLRIIDRASLLAVDREGGDDLSHLVEEVGKKLGQKLTPLGPDVWQWEARKTAIFSLGQSVSPAASRLLREALRKGETQSIRLAWLAPVVLQYIKSQRLYSS